ncbi:MAG: TIGR02452 family protein [Acholeplasmatales bacterium]|nr:TIGR02452 family protein [Acholeplasmatales bacterium]
MKIIIVKGDITTAITDAIVCAANSRLAPSSGECGAIFNLAGYDELKDALSKYKYCKPGDAVITPGFKLNSKYIIHAVGPIYKENPDDDLLLASAYINSLNLAIDNNCLTIAFPALSTGLYDYPYELAANIAISTLYDYKKIHDNDLAYVYIYCYDDEIYKVFNDVHYKFVNDWKRNISDIVKLGDTLKDRDTRVQSFKNTRDLYMNDKTLIKSIKETKKNTKLYLEGFEAKNKESKYDTKIVFERLTSLDATRKYANQKVALLNFASGTHPGGGVLTGSNAQEESICRASTLYKCLNDETGNIYEFFYGYHKTLGNIYSDRIIYSPNILVFKDSNKENTLLDKNDWYKINVISSSAPNLKDEKILDSELYNIIITRIKNIFEVAIENEIEVLILGAFGCGSFNNNSLVNAKAFKEICDSYKGLIKTIVFAIPDESDEKSANYRIFENIIG